MIVYKYFNRKYVKKYERKMFYVNTFENIRDYDQGEIGDKCEGVSRNISGDLHIDGSNNPRNQRAIADLKRVGMIDIGSGGNIDIKVENCHFETTFPNAHMFCVTKQRNDTYWRNVPESQGGPYDYCAKISDFEHFSRQVCNAIESHYAIGFHDINAKHCYYEDKPGNIAEGTTHLLDCFRKYGKQDYEEQQEIRSVFCPIISGNIKLKPLLLKVNGVKDIVSILKH